MREIKFRFWDDKQKVMFDVMAVDFYHGEVAVKLTYRDGVSQVCDIGAVNLENGWLLQYTGLKDRNGKEIYEGDIVVNSNLKDIPNNMFGRVTWHQKGFIVFPLAHDWWEGKEVQMCPNLENPEFLEVIGNIYENPELLKRV